MPSFPIDTTKTKRIVISVGGSMIFPDTVNVPFMSEFKEFVEEQVTNGWKFLLITGGGQLTRIFQAGAQEILGPEVKKEDLDWLGIHTTRVNAHLMRTVFADIAQPVIVTNPEEDEIDLNAKVVVSGGWKPGWSTDYVASKIAERIHAPYVVNLTNVSQIYDDDPKKNSNAKPIEEMSWSQYRTMVGNEWIPGMNIPYDPIAAKLCQENDITVLIMNGNKLENLKSAMKNGTFFGSLLKN